MLADVDEHLGADTRALDRRHLLVPTAAVTIPAANTIARCRSRSRLPGLSERGFEHPAGDGDH